MISLRDKRQILWEYRQAFMRGDLATVSAIQKANELPLEEYEAEIVDILRHES